MNRQTRLEDVLRLCPMCRTLHTRRTHYTRCARRLEMQDGRARCAVRAEAYANGVYSAGARGPLPDTLYGVLYDKAHLSSDSFKSALGDALLQAGVAVAGKSASQPLYDFSHLFDKDKVGLGLSSLKLLLFYLSNSNHSLFVIAGGTNLHANPRPA